MSYSDSGFGAPCFACRGNYKKRVFWKNEEKKELGGHDEFCAQCHPNAPSPPMLRTGQMEISEEEFNKLSLTKEWKVHSSSKARL